MSGNGRNKKAIQSEVMRSKDKWGSEVKLIVGDKTKGFLFKVKRQIPTPSQADAYDVDGMTIALCILGKYQEEKPLTDTIQVLVPDKILPKQLTRAIAEHIQSHWIESLEKEDVEKGWLIPETLEWVESAFLDLIRLKPKMIEMYMGTSPITGMTQRRYTITPDAVEIVSLTDAVEKVSLTDAAAEELSPEEAARAAEFYREREAERLDAEAKKLEQDRIEGERKRRLQEQGKFEDGAPGMSKKEIAERLAAKKARKGARLAKTGSRCKKASGDKHAAK
jgi:hypothetical protein